HKNRSRHGFPPANEALGNKCASLLKARIERNKHGVHILNGFRMKEGAEFARRLSRAGLENATEVTLIGETGIACNIRKVGPARGQGTAGMLYAQTVCEFRHGAA